MFSFFEKNDSAQKNAVHQLKSLRNKVLQLELENAWPNKHALDAAFLATKKHLQRDLKHQESQYGFMVSVDGNVEEQTQQCMDRLRMAQSQGRAPSLTSICLFALDGFGITPAPDILNMMLMGAVLGDVENTQPYHDNMHYKKVLMQVIRLVSAHNDIYKSTARAFSDLDICLLLTAACSSDLDICLLLTAACIHDIGHDGLGNMIKGVHIQGRMEKLSFEYAVPYFKAAGCVDKDILDRLLVMLLTTDVSPLDDPGNPAGQMKAAYRFHFLGEKAKAHSLNLDPELDALEKNASLATLCLILHEADIATSAGLGYEITQYETSLLRKEFCGDEGLPSHVVDFLEQVCGQRFLSDAGQKLYAANMARIYTRAEEDVKNGNHPFPKPEHTDFILGTTQSDSASKTIN